MPGHKLDPIDRKIRAELQGDAPRTNVELARRGRELIAGNDKARAGCAGLSCA